MELLLGSRFHEIDKGDAGDVEEYFRKYCGFFLWHSCGCVFEIMEDVIASRIDAKHSNEDAVAHFDIWIERYSERIGLLGGFDMDFLCSSTEKQVYGEVLRRGRKFRESTRGYALGSGNSIPGYVQVENFSAMVRAAREISR